MEPEVKIQRRKTRQVMVGNVPVGGDAPISVQSMTNTETCDVQATVCQILRLEDAGADLMVISEIKHHIKITSREMKIPFLVVDHDIVLRPYYELCMRVSGRNSGPFLLQDTFTIERFGDSSKYWDTFVASPKQRGSRPVAMGSSEPVWPAFLALNRRRAFCSA